LLTQVLSDYLSTNKKLDLDGIMFRSTQLPDLPYANLNVIIFAKASNVALSSAAHGQGMGGNWQPDGEMPFFFADSEGRGPYVRVPDNKYPPLRYDMDALFSREFHLVLDRGSLVINEVNWAIYDTTPIKVESKTYTPPSSPWNDEQFKLQSTLKGERWSFPKKGND
jgi:hypothetical protein